MTKFDGHPFFYRVVTIGLVSLLGGGLGVLGVTSVYHLNEKNSKNLPKQPINSKETVSSRSESPNTEDEFNGQSTIKSQVSENITSSNEINQNQLTNTQTSTTGLLKTSTQESESTKMEDMSVERLCYEIWKYNTSGGPSPSAFSMS